MVQFLEIPAPPALASVVQSFWFLRGNLTGAPTEVIVPDGRMEIVLHLGEPFAQVDPDGCLRRQVDALAAGQLTGPIRLQPRGESDVIGIRLRSSAARAVLRAPIAELNETVTPLAQVRRSLVDALTDAAAREARPEARVERLTAVLGRMGVGEPPELVRAAVRALSLPDAPKVHALARRLGTTPRTLERRVLDETGLSPRMLRKVFRFRRAFRLLSGAPVGQWGTVAAQAGYFDQAHLIRDFRAFTGEAPTTFFQQDPAFASALLGAETPAA